MTNQYDLFTLNEVKAVYSHKTKPSLQPKITGSSEAYKLVFPSWLEDIDHYESFKIMFLSRGNRVLGISNMFTGGITATVIDVRRIFQTALACNASAVILMHNHPSGTMVASDADLQITRKCKDAGQLLDISVLDHIIFTSENYLSMADEGLLN